MTKKEEVAILKVIWELLPRDRMLFIEIDTFNDDITKLTMQTIISTTSDVLVQCQVVEDKINFEHRSLPSRRKK
jgi:hypothetical protein